MDMKKITQEIKKKLQAPFPEEAKSPHPTKPYLTTIKAAYVMERLNDVFGVCGWTIEHTIVSDDSEYVVVGGCIYLPEFELRTPDQYGGHGKTGTNTEPADGYKSAVTDLMSKSASYLEIGIDVFKDVNGKARMPAKAKPGAPAKQGTKVEAADTVIPPFANTKEFAEVCANPPLKIWPSKICEALSISKLSEIKDFTKAYQDLLDIFQVAPAGNK